MSSLSPLQRSSNSCWYQCHHLFPRSLVHSPLTTAYSVSVRFQTYEHIFKSFPKIEMLHLSAIPDENDNDVDLLPNSLNSFVTYLERSSALAVSPLKVQLLEGLQYFALVCSGSPDQSCYSYLHRCRNLQRLVFNHTGHVNFLFLRSMPQLRYLADYSNRGIRAEDAMVISREAPSLHCFNFFLSSQDNSLGYFESVGHELSRVKQLIVAGKKRIFKRLLRVFLSNRSLFCQVTSLRFYSLPGDPEELIISNKCRLNCTISHILMEPKFCQKSCSICWEKISHRKCQRCNCFVSTIVPS